MVWEGSRPAQGPSKCVASELKPHKPCSTSMPVAGTQAGWNWSPPCSCRETLADFPSAPLLPVAVTQLKLYHIQRRWQPGLFPIRRGMHLYQESLAPPRGPREPPSLGCLRAEVPDAPKTRPTTLGATPFFNHLSVSSPAAWLLPNPVSPFSQSGVSPSLCSSKLPTSP